MQEKDSTTGPEPKRFTTPDGKHTLLIIDDPAPVEPEQLAARAWAARLLAEAPSIAEEPPTAEQMAARREFIAKHCDAGDVVLPLHDEDLVSRLLGEFEGLSPILLFGDTPRAGLYSDAEDPNAAATMREALEQMDAYLKAENVEVPALVSPHLEHFIGADHAGGPDKASTTVWARDADGKPVLLVEALDDFRVAAHQAGVSSELLTDSYNELAKVIGLQEVEKTMHGLDHLEPGDAKTEADALTDAVFAEAGRRIEEQDRDRTKLKKQKAKRKARRKTANASKRGNR